MPAYTMKAIPTIYKGIQFRSRLEAKWAAFFDLLGWKWEYEPFDLDGWIPDFLLTRHRVLVEVKPIDTFPADVAAEIDRAIPEKYEALIVGHSIPLESIWRGSIDPITSEPTDEYVVVDGCDGMTIGYMLGRALHWQPKIRPTWGLGLVQKFRFPEPRGFEQYECTPAWDLFHSHDHLFYVDPGFDPGRCQDSLFKFARPRARSTGELKFWKHEEIPDLWHRAANRSQWKGIQSLTRS